jgi:DNA polymerase III alpha subunit (gram-positive type)
MRYLAIDIETTGLDENYCQILEIGAVVEPGGESFQTYIEHPYIQGDPFALNMNAQIIERIVKKQPGWNYCAFDRAFVALEEFCYKHFSDAFRPENPEPIILAGKNVGTFDLRFLRKLKYWKDSRFHRRILDPMMYYLQRDDELPPDTKTCCQRAGISLNGLHDAVSDCRTVIELIRRGPDFVRRCDGV